MQKKLTILNSDILATIVYYDGLDFALTSFEIWKYLMRLDYCEAEVGKYRQTSMNEIISALDSRELRYFIESSRGFYFLKGREALSRRRIESGKISQPKLEGLHAVVGLLRFVPFVRMVGMTGRLAMKNANKASDWDVLIVLESGHIWLGRLLVTALVQILGKRRHGKNISNRVCLNYYLTDGALEIATKDLFSANEYYFLFPLFGKEIYRSFQLRNKWIKKMKPHYAPTQLFPIAIWEESVLSRKIRAWGEFLLGNKKIELGLKRWQEKKILKNPKTYLEGGLIRYSDEALVFLPSPHGPAIFEKFKEKIGEIGL